MPEFVQSGYPRSGNTFTAYAVALLRESIPKRHNHTVRAIVESEIVYIPIRNPLDCIASWSLYQNRSVLVDDIRYYIRFHTAALSASNVIFLDFDKFTTDLTYIAQKIDAVIPDGMTVESVKQAMLDTGRKLNLPQDNMAELDAIKAELQQMPEFAECIALYEQMKALA